MAETTSASVSSSEGDSNWRENKLVKGTFAVSGIMLTLVTYGILQVYIANFSLLLILVEPRDLVVLLKTNSNYIFVGFVIVSFLSLLSIL